jgi:aerobic carbon-monoxide dehydrogenase small subunit
MWHQTSATPGDILSAARSRRATGMTDVSITVNGVLQRVPCPSNTLLSTLLREQLCLTGTHVGCDTSQCGACTVIVDGRSIKSCTMLALEADGATVTTIEGLAKSDGTLHPVQEAFRVHHALQCGYCTPGMVMASVALLARVPDPTDAQVRHGLEGNLCRCTGYQNIIDAVLASAKTLKSA